MVRVADEARLRSPVAAGRVARPEFLRLLPETDALRNQLNDGDHMTDQVAPPAPDTKSNTNLPTLLRNGTSYQVFDPALLEGGEHTLAPNGTLTHRHATVRGLMCLLGIAAPAVLAPLLLGDGAWWTYPLLAVVGAFVGFLVVGFSLTAFTSDPLKEYRKRTGGAEPSVAVDHGDGQAFRLCELAEEIASSDAWRRKAIDPDRLVAAILWSSVTRATSITEERRRLRELSGTSVLVTARNEIESSAANLDQVEANLREIRRLARELDARALLNTGAAGLDKSGRRSDADVGVAASEAILEQSRVLRELL